MEQTINRLPPAGLSREAQMVRKSVLRAEHAFRNTHASAQDVAAVYMPAARAGALERALREASGVLQAPWQSLHKMGYGDSGLCQRIQALRAELDTLADSLGVAVVLDR